MIRIIENKKKKIGVCVRTISKTGKELRRHCWSRDITTPLSGPALIPRPCPAPLSRALVWPRPCPPPLSPALICSRNRASYC